MEFTSLPFDQQKQYLINPENLKKIRGYLSTLKYEIAQTISPNIHYHIETMYVFVMQLSRVISGFIENFTPSQELIFDWGNKIIPEEIREKNLKMKRVLDLYVFALANFFETSTSVIGNITLMIAQLEAQFNSTQRMFHGRIFGGLFAGNMSFLIIKNEMNIAIDDVKIQMENIWTSSLDCIDFIFDSLETTLDRYPEIINDISDDWKNLLDYALRNEELITFPESMGSVSVALASHNKIPLNLRILLRDWYIRNVGDFEELNLEDACMDLVNCSKLYKKDTTLMPDFLLSISNLYKSIERGDEGFILISEHILEQIIYHLCNFVKNYQNKEMNTLENTLHERSIYMASKIVYDVLQAHDFTDSYLIRHLVVSYMSFMNEIQEQSEDEIVEKLMTYLEKSPHFYRYLVSLYEEKDLEKLEPYVSKVFYDIVIKNNIKRYTQLFNGDESTEFTDTITSSLIINPGIIKNGEHILWVDAHMILSHLMDKEENPFTREHLTIEEWKKYNEENSEKIMEYKEKLNKFLTKPLDE